MGQELYMTYFADAKKKWGEVMITMLAGAIEALPRLPVASSTEGTMQETIDGFRTRKLGMKCM